MKTISILLYLIGYSCSYTTAYAEAVSAFGRMIEVRVARNTQHLPIFVRMLDKVLDEFGGNKAIFKFIQPKLTL